jgi:hypothetical protein
LGAVGIVAAQALDERGDRVVVAVAGSVVGEDPLLGRPFDVLETRTDASGRVADCLGLGQGDCALQDVHRGSCIAAGERDQVIERGRLECHAALGPERA